MANYRLFGEWAVLFLASALLVIFSLQNGWTQKIDAIALDLATEWRAGPADERIVLVEIDDRSLSEVGNWPWDRRRHAELVRSLASSAPSSIVFDILFLDAGDAQADADLALAMGSYGKVHLPHTFAGKPGTAGQITVDLPVPELREVASNIGHVAILPDQDGVLRRFDPGMVADGRVWPHLVEAAARDLDGSSAIDEKFVAPPISTMRPTGSFRQIAAADIIAGNTPPELIRGKLVIIGATAQGLGDRYSVPDYAGRIMSGSEIQANFLSATLNNELVRIVDLRTVGIALIFALAMVFVALWKLPPRWALRLSVAMAIGLLASSVVLVVAAGIWIPVAPALLGILLAYPLWGWRRLSAVSRFLENEAAGLLDFNRSTDDQPTAGFDTVAQQVTQIKSLIGNTKDRLVFFRQLISASPDPILVFDDIGALTLMNSRSEKLFGELSRTNGLTFADLIAEQRASLDVENGELTLANGDAYLVAQSDVGLGKNNRIFALRNISVLRQNERQRAEMLEFLSHDMRSPQVAIIGLSSATGETDAQSDRFKRIEGQARRTLKLTDDFVQISRLDYEGIKREETDIGALLHEALDRAYPLAKRKGIGLKSRIPTEPEFCDVDPFALSRAIDNLLGNAIKFSPDKADVQLVMSRDDCDKISIGVSDSGPGLPEERLINTFARFGAHDSNAGPSAGLGLAFVKMVIDQHGGEIEVHSDSNTGTHFSLTLPCPNKING